MVQKRVLDRFGKHNLRGEMMNVSELIETLQSLSPNRPVTAVINTRRLGNRCRKVRIYVGSSFYVRLTATDHGRGQIVGYDNVDRRRDS